MTALLLNACEMGTQKFTVKKNNDNDPSLTKVNLGGVQDIFNDVSDFPFDQILRVEVDLRANGSVKTIVLKNAAGAGIVVPAAYELDKVQAVKKGNFVIMNFPRVSGGVATLVLSKASDGAYRINAFEGLSLAYVDLSQSPVLNDDGTLSIRFFDEKGVRKTYTADVDAQKRLRLIRE